MHNAVIRFPVSAQTRSQWVALDPENLDLFDRPLMSAALLEQIQQEVFGFEGDFLVLYLDAEVYRPVYSGDSTSIKQGMRSPFMVVAAKTYGFEAEIIDFRPAIYFLLKFFQESQESRSGDYPGVICLDSCAIDQPADLPWGYTVRRGVLEVERTKGLMTSDAGEGGLPVSFGVRILFNQA